MQIKLAIFLIVVSLAGITGTILKALEASEKEGTIKAKDETIKVLENANKEQIKAHKIVFDSLVSIIEEQSGNKNVVNLSFDKTKLKGSGNIIIDTKQLQSLACDTTNIIRWYEKLSKKEQRKYK